MHARAQPLIDAAQRRLANFQPMTGNGLGHCLGRQQPMPTRRRIDLLYRIHSEPLLALVLLLVLFLLILVGVVLLISGRAL